MVAALVVEMVMVPAMLMQSPSGNSLTDFPKLHSRKVLASFSFACPFTKLEVEEGPTHFLHSADDGAVKWLTSFGI